MAQCLFHGNVHSVHHPWLLFPASSRHGSLIRSLQPPSGPLLQMQTGQGAPEVTQSLEGNGYVARWTPSRGCGIHSASPLPPAPLSRGSGRGSHAPRRWGRTVIPVGTWVWLKRPVWGLFSFAAQVSSPPQVPWWALQESPSPQQPAALPVRVGLQGTLVVTKHWILLASFHPTFPNNAAS